LDAEFRRLGAPLDVLHLDEPHIREVYGCAILLLRPDLHIFWRGEALPASAPELARAATGCSGTTACSAVAVAE
jgi:hypothetical protein